MSAQDLIRDDRLLSEAIAAVDPAQATALVAELPGAGVAAAAAALVAGTHHQAAAVPALVRQLGEDGVAGLAAAWALAELGAELGAEAAVIAAIPEGRLDLRQNGYTALAGIAARGKASAALAGFLTARVEAELERAKGGGTGLADQALRALGALAGVAGFDELVQRVVDGDRFCDRFELDRLRKQVADRGRATDLVKDLTAGWAVIFADHTYVAPAPKPEPAPAPAKPAAKAPAGPMGRNPLAPPRATRPPEPAPVPEPAADAHDAEAGFADDGATFEDGPIGDGSEGPEGVNRQIDWKAFSESPEFLALNPQSQGLVAQLGPILESLAAQAIRALLADLTGQEFAALLLQVLPQALPQQHVQTALHPHALNGYQALARYLERTGLATNGGDLVTGVKQVRQALQAQMRRTGMLGGPDYSDPEDAAAAAP